MILAQKLYFDVFLQFKNANALVKEQVQIYLMEYSWKLPHSQMLKYTLGFASWKNRGDRGGRRKRYEVNKAEKHWSKQINVLLSGTRNSRPQYYHTETGKNVFLEEKAQEITTPII